MAMSKALKTQFVQAVREAYRVNPEAGKLASKYFRYAKNTAHSIDYCTRDDERRDARSIINEYMSRITTLVGKLQKPVTHAELIGKQITFDHCGIPRVGVVTQYRKGKDGEEDFVYAKTESQSLKLPRSQWNAVRFM